MNKRNSLLQFPPMFFGLMRSLACAWFLTALSARADDTTNAAANSSSASASSQAAAGSSSDNGTNQDLTKMSLEQLMQIQIPVVESASKFEQKATEAPADATVITSDEIKKYGWRTLGDLLGSVPGFYISYDHVYDYVGVSGVNLGDANNRILLLVNGHRINNDLNDSAPVDTSFILDVDLIDRVEIIRGPGSVLYGNNAFFAVINVITRQGKQIDGVEGSGTYGSYNEGSGRVTLGGQFTNSLQFLLSGTIYNNNGIDDLDFPEAEFQNFNHGVAHHMDADNFQSFFGSVSYRDLTLEGGYINRDKVNPTAVDGTTFNDSQSQIIDDRSYVTLKYEHQFDGGWDVLGDVYYDQSDKELDLPESGGAGVFSPGGAFVQEQETGQWAGTEVQVNKKILDKDTLSFGGEYRNDFEQDVKVYENGVFEGEPINTNRQNYGIFGQADVAILDNLRVNAGVRYDEYGNYTPDWSPRAALIYNPWQPSTFKFIYGTAFRDPNVLEVGNAADVHPEKISSYQFIYEQGINRFLRSSVMGYYDHMDDLIGLDSSGLYSNFDAHTLGAELALEAKWKELNARLSYSLQRTVNCDTDIILPDSPENMIKFNVSAPLYQDKIFAGLEVQYTSQSRTEYFNYLATGAPFVVAGPNSPGFTIVNFTIFSQDLFVKNLELSATVYNLLNTKFYEPSANAEPEPSIRQNGINFRLKLTYRF
jgi:outer membrane receptor for ferrienterochelin and colicins